MGPASIASRLGCLVSALINPSRKPSHQGEKTIRMKSTAMSFHHGIPPFPLSRCTRSTLLSNEGKKNQENTARGTGQIERPEKCLYSAQFL